jgi:hypothetical protein
MGEQALREAQADKFDMMVRMLTTLSIESCTMETKIKKAAGNPQAEPLDTGQLGGAVGSSRGKAEGKRGKEREGEGDHTSRVEQKRRRSCLPPLGLSKCFI